MLKSLVVRWEIIVILAVAVRLSSLHSCKLSKTSAGKYFSGNNLFFSFNPTLFLSQDWPARFRHILCNSRRSILRGWFNFVAHFELLIQNVIFNDWGFFALLLYLFQQAIGFHFEFWCKLFIWFIFVDQSKIGIFLVFAASQFNVL